jgi:RNA polymerase sigma-70 factor (ECF subfamily)
MGNTGTKEVVEHFFRHEYGKVVSLLTSHFGTSYLNTIEDAVQEALLSAMRAWSLQGAPLNPSAWIFKAARNKIIDEARKQQVFNAKQEDIGRYLKELEYLQSGYVSIELELKDSLLKMIFACCDLSLSTENHIILILKILCGFSNAEIASALLKKEAAVAKAYTRARNKLREINIKPEVPAGENLEKQLPTVLHILYLIFNEGYKASGGEILIKKDLCLEAVRLLSLLPEIPGCDKPEVHALLALMYLHSARFSARTGSNGELITLKGQDRSKWDKALIKKGMDELLSSAVGDKLSAYHVEAAISECHCLARDYGSTDWKEILQLYDLLSRLKPSPVVLLNRIVALAEVKGAREALTEMKELQNPLKDYYLYYAIKGDLLRWLGEDDDAKEMYRKALKLSGNKAEKAFLKKKIGT